MKIFGYEFKAILPEVAAAISTPIKDPNDLALTRSSTKWETEDYCQHCYATVEYSEWMAKICNSCGKHSRWHYQTRSYRKIWNGERWAIQRNYPGNELIMKGEETPTHN